LPLFLILGGVTLVALLAPRLILRRDERRAAPPTGLGDPIPEVTEIVVPTEDGAELHVFQLGSGPPIVFVHGLGLDHRSWNYQFRDLSDRFRLIAVDLRGHGRSTLGTEPIGPGRFAADLATVLDHLDLRGAVVVGHSLGGTVVGQLCADSPATVRDRVAGLVFVGTFASAIAGEGKLREVISPGLIRAGAKLRTSSEPRGEASSGAMAYVMARAPFGPNPQPEQVRHTLAMGAAAAPAVISAATVANLTYDVRDRLDLVGVPALVLRGEHDTLSTARSVSQLAKAMPQCEVVTIADSGHLPMLEARHQFDELLAGFVTGLTGPAPATG
jgi:pimeloyl-ACP methyl ester carboxylesterase